VPAEQISRAEVEAARLYPHDITASQLTQQLAGVARLLHGRGEPDRAATVYGGMEVLRDGDRDLGVTLRGLRERLHTIADTARGLAGLLVAAGLVDEVAACACGNRQLSSHVHSPRECYRVGLGPHDTLPPGPDAPRHSMHCQPGACVNTCEVYLDGGPELSADLRES